MLVSNSIWNRKENITLHEKYFCKLKPDTFYGPPCRPKYNFRRPHKQRSFREGMTTIYITISLAKASNFRDIEDRSLKEQSEKSMSNEDLSTQRKSSLKLNLSKPGMFCAKIQFNWVHSSYSKIILVKIPLPSLFRSICPGNLLWSWFFLKFFITYWTPAFHLTDWFSWQVSVWMGLWMGLNRLRLYSSNYANN